MYKSSSTQPDALVTQLISSEAFGQLTGEWKRTNDFHHVNLAPYFLDVDRLQLGAGFDRDTMLAFLSTIGLVTVKIRFGLDSDDQNFKLVLYGVDRTNVRITPYLLGSPLYDIEYNPIKIKSNNQFYSGYLPNALATSWIDNWKEKGREATDSLFRLTNFDKPYWLEGYNYSMREFIDALYPDDQAGDIYISFVLHQYFQKEDVSAGPESETSFVYTFGLIFQGVNRPSDNSSGVNSSSDVVSGGYYDFTAPCPPTCKPPTNE